MNYLEVIAAIVVKDGKVLVGKRRSDKVLGGKWEFPGGKLEKGETHQECLVRELGEELGVKIKVGDFIYTCTHTYKEFPVRLHGYYAEHTEGDIVPCEHDEIKWVQPDELEAIDFAEAGWPIVKKVANDLIR